MIAGLTKERDALRADLRELGERNKRMRDFIERRGWGHTDWPDDKLGCKGPGPTCVAKCIARCEDVDNLNATAFDLRDDLRACAEGLRRFVRIWRGDDPCFDTGCTMVADTSGTVFHYNTCELARAALARPGVREAARCVEDMRVRQEVLAL